MIAKDIEDWFNQAQLLTEPWCKAHQLDLILQEKNTPYDVLLRIEFEISENKLPKCFGLIPQKVKTHPNYKSTQEIIEKIFFD